MTSSYDIVGIGCAAVDDLLYVDAYPPADAKTQVRQRDRQCGGLTATALVAAARLGSKCAYGGMLGDNDLSRFVIDTMNREGIDTGPVLRRPAAAPVSSVIIVDRATGARNIFFDLSGLLDPIDEPTLPALVRSGRVLFLDHLTALRMLRAAQAASEAGIPIVADLESDESPHFPALLALVDHLVISLAFAQKITGLTDPAAIARKLLAPSRRAVVVTCGDQGAWWTAGSGDPQHQPAFAVDVVDTTGCGDVFHGAYASALARGLPLPDRVRFAAAAAALKATRPGGQAGIPNRATVEQFLADTRRRG